MKATIFVFNNDLFFRNFRYLKEKYCLPRRALSKLLGMSVFAIEAMENNQWGDALELEKLERVCQIFNADFHDIISKDLSQEV